MIEPLAAREVALSCLESVELVFPVNCGGWLQQAYRGEPIAKPLAKNVAAIQRLKELADERLGDSTIREIELSLAAAGKSQILEEAGEAATTFHGIAARLPLRVGSIVAKAALSLELFEFDHDDWAGVILSTGEALAQRVCEVTVETRPLTQYSRIEAGIRSEWSLLAAYIEQNYSEIRTPSEWDSIFKMSWKTLRRRIDAGGIRAIEVGAQAWRIHRSDIPGGQK